MNAFSRTALKTATSGGIIATALIAFTGVAAQATILPSCDGVTSIPATEVALRAALAGTDPVICIEPGTIDLSSAGIDSTPGSIEITRSVAIIGANGAILDGGGDSEIFTIPNAVDAVDVTVQNLTFQNGYTDQVDHGSAIWFDRPGSLTILQSTFTGNNSFGTAVLVLDSVGAVQPNVTINNSSFIGNDSSADSLYGSAIAGYGDVTITDSTFVGNGGGGAGTVVGSSTMTVRGNLFENNNATAEGGAISGLSGTGAIDISNNTFHLNDSYQGGAIYLEREATVENNTFVDNEASELGDAIYTRAPGATSLFGNIFAASGIGPTVGELAAVFDGTFIDLGANISTFAADATYLTTSALTPGQVGASYASIGLSALADNGGPTQTMALTSPSVAIGAVTPAIYLAATGITKPSVDQRGVYRGNGTEASDAGAYELSTHIVPVDPAELAKTGFGADSQASIALAGAALLGGAALIGGATVRNRRRRQSF
jgi:hypothetical protein